MITTQINSYADLVKERKRLKKEIAQYELLLKDHIVSLEHSLRPANIAVDFAHKIAEPSHEGLIGTGVKNLVGGIASTVFAGYSWPIRFALTQITKNMAGKYANNQAPAIAGFIARWIQRKRENKILREEQRLKTV